MNQSELIEKVARAAELNQVAAGQALKAVVNAIRDSLAAGEAVRVSGLGTFNVASRPARKGRNPQSGETIKIAASKAVRFHAGKAVKEALNPPSKTLRKKSATPKKSAVRTYRLRPIPCRGVRRINAGHSVCRSFQLMLPE